jgi:hypothetical protein
MSKVRELEVLCSLSKLASCSSWCIISLRGDRIGGVWQHE